MRARLFIPAALVPAALLAAALALAAAGAPAGNDSPGSARVRRGRFELRVREAGELKPLRCRVVLARAGGKLEWLAPEGASVAPGDQLFTLDRVSQNDWLTRDTNELEAAQRNLQEVRKQVESEREAVAIGIKIKEEAVKLAETGQAETNAGATREALDEARAALQAAEAGERDKRAAAADDAALAAKGYLSAAEAEASRLAAELAAAGRERAKLNLALLEAGATREARAAARLAVERARADLDMTRADAAAKAAELAGRIADAQAQVASLERSVDYAKREIANRVVSANAAGVVIYRKFGRHRDERIDVGTRVWPGAGVLDVADLSRMKVRSQLAERYIRYLAPGATVKVAIDGPPGPELAAKVTWIDRWARDRSADLAKADREKEGLSGVKVFALEAAVDGSDQRARPGARCRLDIPLLDIPDALIVPRAALYGAGAERFVLRARGRQIQRVPVEVLAEGEGEAAVQGALGEGEELLSRGSP